LQIEPFINDNSKESLSKHRHYVKLSQGLCLSCNKPAVSTQYLCGDCFYQLRVNGLEQEYITFTDVGLSVINYQQFLHKKFFHCNAYIAHRGIATNRIKCTNIKEETILKSINRLHNYLIASKIHQIQYKEVQYLRNFTRRLIFNQLLYSISYNIVNFNQFKSLAHYQTTIVRKLYNDINRAYRRTGGDIGVVQPYHKVNRLISNILTEYNMLVSCVTPLLVELVKE